MYLRVGVEFYLGDVCPRDHDGSEVVMRSKVLSSPLLIFLLSKGDIVRALQLLIIDVLKFVIERAVMSAVDLCNSLMEDEIGLVIDTHQLALKRPAVLSGHSHPSSDVALLQFFLGRGLLHLIDRVDYLYCGE